MEILISLQMGKKYSDYLAGQLETNEAYYTF